jgi:hypothetical protein
VDAHNGPSQVNLLLLLHTKSGQHKKPERHQFTYSEIGWRSFSKFHQLSFINFLILSKDILLVRVSCIHFFFFFPFFLYELCKYAYWKNYQWHIKKSRLPAANHKNSKYPCVIKKNKKGVWVNKLVDCLFWIDNSIQEFLAEARRKSRRFWFFMIAFGACGFDGCHELALVFFDLWVCLNSIMAFKATNIGCKVYDICFLLAKIHMLITHRHADWDCQNQTSCHHHIHFLPLPHTEINFFIWPIANLM